MFRFRRLLCWALSLFLILPLLPAKAGEPDLKALQERLLSLGYEIGPADGILGRKTSAALALAQTLLAENGFGVIPTGMPDPLTCTLLADEQNAPLLRTLLSGSWGTRVREAQLRLIGLNLLRDSADGIYGTNTESAVSAFERMFTEKNPDLFQPDGRLSPDEYDFLMSDPAAWGIEAPVCYDESRPESLTAGYLYARNALLIDAVTGDVLLEKAADDPAEPASTTKIITLLTALSLCDPEEEITVPASAADVPADSSLVPVYPGEKMTMRDLLYAMMIRSGNDAANAVAELCSGSVEAFVGQMNALAADLGMDGSSFVNPHGYAAEGHFTTARDLVTAARYGLTLEEFRKIVTCSQYVLPATENREPLVLTVKWEIFDPSSEYWIPHAAGIKSGYTSSAGFCYVGAYQEDGRTLIAAVLGGRTRNMAWTDLKRLFAFGMTAIRTESPSEEAPAEKP